MINFDILVISVVRSILVWFGMWLLLGGNIKKSTLIKNFLFTTIFRYVGYIFVGTWIGPFLFIATFFFTNLTLKGFKHKADKNFFHLAVVFMNIILGRTWAAWVVYRISLLNNIDYKLFEYTPIHSYHYQVVVENWGIYRLPIIAFLEISIITAFLFGCKYAIRKTKFSDFIQSSNSEYLKLLAIAAGVGLIGHYIIIFAPAILGITCQDLVRLHPLYLSTIMFLSFSLIFLLRVIVRKEDALLQRKLNLKELNDKLFDTKIRLATLETEVVDKEILIEQLDKNIQEMDNLQQRLRDFEHGQNNLLIAIAGAVESDNKEVIAELLKQYDVKVHGVSKHKMAYPEINQLKTSKLWAIRRLLLAKIEMASVHDIKFTIEVPEPVEEVGIPVLDLVDMLGVWLDNAIEEAVFTTDKWVHISFLEIKNDDIVTSLEIRVSNSCRCQNLNLEDLEVRGFSTKGEGRGVGLAIVSDIMEQLDNIYLSTKITDDKYVQLLEIELF